MTHPNQSELYDQLNELFLRGERLGRSIYVSDDERHDAVKNAIRYITANYTPNSEVAERERLARIDENDSWMEWIDNCRVTYDNPEHDGEKASAELHNLFTSRIVQLTKAKEATK